MKRALTAFFAGQALVVLALVGLTLATGGQIAAAPAAYAAPLLVTDTHTVLTPTTMAATGITMTLTAAVTDGHKFANTGRDFVVIANDSGSTITLTVTTGGTVGGIAIEDVIVGVPDGATKIVGPFNKSIFDQGGTDLGKVYLGYSSPTDVTVGVFRTP